MQDRQHFSSQASSLSNHNNLLSQHSPVAAQPAAQFHYADESDGNEGDGENGDGNDGDNATVESVYIYHPFTEKRHESNANPKANIPTQSPTQLQLQDWRMRERLKTVHVALVVCLNIGIDPPDVVKTNPCSKLECWIDPFSMPQQKALETIGSTLQKQYEAWQPRAKYRPSLDPSVEDTKKLCSSLRRSAKDDRILFHYNGHGVPRPTPGGELWVFNRTYTQYIPVSMYDIQTWLGSPCIYVYDCSNAGNILNSFNRFAEQRDSEATRNQVAVAAASAATLKTDGASNGTAESSTIPPASTSQPPATPMRECIQLAACGPTEILPMHPDLPADLFTCCLTTPIVIALRWFVSRNRLLTNITPDMIMKIPGRLSDRRTPLGELNWIFTAITDTIAWNVLPHQLFKKLFRQDLMVAALFRNFLLAERIMRYYNCNPISTPALPATHHHPMWQAWDLAADMCLSQLPALELDETSYKHSPFFSDQLTAFEIWLQKGSISKHPPEQLPIVLQVLLSQQHRHRALMLLSKFLDLGPWAVNLALSVGIFPYVLKLLQSPAADLKEVLVFIWAKILAVDRSCQSDLVKDNGYTYFINILAANNAVPVAHSLSEHRAMCAFILSIFCHDFPQGKLACFKADLLPALLPHLVDQDPILRQWACLCIGKLMEGFDEARIFAMQTGIHERIAVLLTDTTPEVRSSVLFTLGAILGNPPKKVDESKPKQPNLNTNFPVPNVVQRPDIVLDAEHSIAVSILATASDASPMVRKELVVALSRFVYQNWSKFVSTAHELIDDERRRGSVGLRGLGSVLNGSAGDSRQNRRSTIGGTTMLESPVSRTHSSVSINRLSLANASSTSIAQDFASYVPPSLNTIHGFAWKILLALSVDSFQEVASLAARVVDLVNLSVVSLPSQDASSNLTSSRSSTGLAAITQLNNASRVGSSASLHSVALAAQQQQHQQQQNQLTGQKDKLKRSASFAYTMRSFAGLGTNQADGITEAAARASVGQSRGSIGLLSTTPPTRGRPLSTIISMNTGRTSPAMFESGMETEEEKDVKIVIDPETVALDSKFFEWSAEYFAEPQMKVPEVDDPGSVKYNERQWRRQRNDDVIRETAEIHPFAPSRKFDEQIGLLHNDHHPTSVLTFHQFEPHLVVADDKDYISVFNWETGIRLNAFHCGNPLGSRITSLKLINEDDTALLVTGSDDGIIRVFRRYEKFTTQELVSSFRALPDLLPHSSRLQHSFFIPPSAKVSTPTFSPTSNVSPYDFESNCGLVCDWQQNSAVLVVSGNAKQIKVWDMERELCIQDVPTNTMAHVTSLTSDRVAGNLIVAGFGDGAVRVYDSRLAPHKSVLLEYNEHPSSVLRVHLHSGNSPLLISGSVAGDVRFWDVRQPTGSIRCLENRAGLGSEMTSFAVHEYASIFACGSSLTRDVRTYSLDGKPLGTMRSLEGFMGQRLGPISSLEFHPHKLVLAVGQSRNSSVMSNSMMSASSTNISAMTSGLNPALSPNMTAFPAISLTTSSSGSSGGGLSIPIFASELAGRNAANVKAAVLAAQENESRTTNSFYEHDDYLGMRSSQNTPALSGVFSSLIGLARTGSFNSLSGLGATQNAQIASPLRQ